MASPSTVLTMGYGVWGTVNLLPTLGFGFGPPLNPTIVSGMEFTIEPNRFHYVVEANRLHYALQEEDR